MSSAVSGFGGGLQGQPLASPSMQHDVFELTSACQAAEREVFKHEPHLGAVSSSPCSDRYASGWLRTRVLRLLCPVSSRKSGRLSCVTSRILAKQARYLPRSCAHSHGNGIG